MNNKIINISRLLTLSVLLFVLLIVKVNKVSAECIGEIECAYTHAISRCSGGDDSGNLCTNNEQCEGVEYLCLPAGDITERDDKSCSAAVGQCTAEAVSCSSPYIQIGGDCSLDSPPPSNPPPPTDPPPPSGCPSPGWCGLCTCPVGTSMGRAAFTFFEDINENGVWDYNDGEPRIHKDAGNNVNNTIPLTGLKLYMNGSQMSVTSNIENSEYTGPTRCSLELHPANDPDKTCKDWGINPATQILWGETCFAEPKTCNKVHWQQWNCEPSNQEEGAICGLAGGAYCAPGEVADLRHGYVYNYKGNVGNRLMTVIPPTGWDISPGSHTVLNTGGSNEFNINITTSGTQVRCNAGLTAIGLIQDLNKQCSVELTSTSIVKNDVIQESTTATVYGYSELTETDETRLHIANSTYTEILDEQGQPFTPAGTELYITNDGERYYYEYTSGGCDTGNSAICVEQTTISDLPLGDYKLHCDLPADPQRCSGNPNCTFEGGSITCTDWVSCSDEDNIDLEVICEQTCSETCGTGITLAEVPGQPGQPSVTDMIDGNKDLTLSNIVEINWTAADISAPATIDGYDVWIYPQNNLLPPLQGATLCSGCEQIFLGNVLTTTYTPHQDQTNEVDIYVRARNTNPCGDIYGPWSLVREVDYVADISGNFYNDPDATAGLGSCSGDQSSPINVSINNPSSTITSNVGGGITGTVFLTSFNIPNVPYVPSLSWDNPLGTQLGNISLALDNSDPTNALACVCPSDSGGFTCDHFDTFAGYESGSVAPTQNFYLTDVDLSNGPWWQAISGLTYGATSTASNIPDTCEAAVSCTEYLITQNADGDTNSAGIPMTGAGSMSLDSGDYTQRAPDQPRALSTTHANMIQENYAHFAREVDLDNTQSTGGISISEIPSGATADDDNTEVYYAGNGNNLALDLTGETIDSGRKVVIFVNGDITFSSTENTNAITVEQSSASFIAFIASGDIIFDATVGNAMNYAAGGGDTISQNIEGVFVADGNIVFDGYSETIGDDDVPDNIFIGEGTFVGWSGFTLNRSYDNDGNPLDRAVNNENPTEIFSFRPDFNENIPEIMMRPSIVWQEIN